MNIPSPNQCFFLIRKMEMMAHIVNHSKYNVEKDPGPGKNIF